MLGAKPIFIKVLGAPFVPGDVVRILSLSDHVGMGHEGQQYGKEGVVKYLEYDCGCGQNYPDDPMIGVAVRGCDDSLEYWGEELELVETNDV